MSIGNNINSINDLELVGDSQNLVDYEIRGNDKVFIINFRRKVDWLIWILFKTILINIKHLC